MTAFSLARSTAISDPAHKTAQSHNRLKRQVLDILTGSLPTVCRHGLKSVTRMGLAPQVPVRAGLEQVRHHHRVIRERRRNQWGRVVVRWSCTQRSALWQINVGTSEVREDLVEAPASLHKGLHYIPTAPRRGCHQGNIRSRKASWRQRPNWWRIRSC